MRVAPRVARACLSDNCLATSVGNNGLATIPTSVSQSHSAVKGERKAHERRDGRQGSPSSSAAGKTAGRAGRGARTVNGPHVQLRWRMVEPGMTMSPPNSQAVESPLTMAVAKRLLKRAVDRNQFRRVVREAWRHRLMAVGTRSSIDGSQPAMYVRLMRASAHWRDLPVGQRKREWRQELDRLFEAVRLPGDAAATSRDGPPPMPSEPRHTTS